MIPVPPEHISNAVVLANAHTINTAIAEYTAYTMVHSDLIFAVYWYCIQTVGSSANQRINIRSGSGGTTLASFSMGNFANNDIGYRNYHQMPNIGMPYFVGQNAGDDLIFENLVSQSTRATFLVGEIVPRGAA